MHLHIIIDNAIPSKVIRHYWYLATSKTSFIIDIKIIENDVYNVAGYMTKYMTKTINNATFKRRERRYGFSRYSGFKGPNKTPDKKYSFIYDPHCTDWESVYRSITGGLPVKPVRDL